MYAELRASQLWLAGVLIAIGVISLVENYTGLKLGNWWGLLILIPTSAALAAAWSAWRSGMSPAAVSRPLVGGLAMLTIAAIVLLELQWSRIWPVFLIVAGIGALVPSLLGRRDRPPREEEIASRG
jgi:hypothetical protein